MSDRTTPSLPPEPRPTEPLRPPVLYATKVSAALEASWREAVRELGSDSFAQAMLKVGIAADGKKALIAWLRCDATRDLLAAFRLRHRVERNRLLDQELGFWDNEHVAAIALALRDRKLHSRLVESMLRQMRERMVTTEG